MKPIHLSITAVLLVLVVGAGVWFWDRPTLPQPPQTMPQPVSPAPEASAPASAATHVILHPIPATSPGTASSASGGIEGVLASLFGREALRSVFFTQDFVHRFVATVDALGREHASPLVWPVERARGRFDVERRKGSAVIGRDNSMRYARYVKILEAVDMQRLFTAYVGLYPQFQRAYRELGYPQGYFNDRFVEVLDLLIATPVIAEPIGIHLPKVAASQAASEHALYVFDDPSLESLSAGQKILLRMGPTSERAVQARLRELRRLITTDNRER